MASEPPVTPEKKSHTGLIVTIVLIVIVVLLALFFGLYFGLRNNEPDTPDEVNPDPDIVEPGPEDPDGDDDGDGEPEHTHTYGDWQYDDTYHWKECECGDVIDKEEHTLDYTDNNDSETHTIYCEICGYETTGEHTWSVTSSTPATCTASGTTYYECELCDATKTEVIEQLGHDPSSEWSSDENGHWHECLNGCGEKLDYADHTPEYKDNEDGTHTEYCSICNYVIETQSHDIEYTQISGDETNHTETCKYCDYTATVAHTFDGYVSDGENGHHQVCSECQYTTATTNHNLGSYISDGVNGHYQECSDCDYTTSDETHDLSYVSDDDTYHHGECSECDYKAESEEHNYETTNITDINLTDVATGEATATYEYTCTECEHTKTEANQPYTLNFTTDPWNIIDEVSTAGYAQTYYSIDDRKTIVVEEEEYEVRIIDFNHDTLTTNNDGYNDNKGIAAITCEMVGCLSTRHNINSTTNGTGNNTGGWDQCEMRTYLNNTIYSELENDLTGVIKQVQKVATCGNKSTSTYTSSDYLFLVAYGEIYSTTTTGYASEGTQYAYYKEYADGYPTLKYRPGSTDPEQNYWLRSPDVSSTTNFRTGAYASSHLMFSSMVTYNSWGISFAFCV